MMQGVAGALDVAGAGAEGAAKASSRHQMPLMMRKVLALVLVLVQ